VLFEALFEALFEVLFEALLAAGVVLAAGKGLAKIKFTRTMPSASTSA
jgi:hypothetical protein